MSFYRQVSVVTCSKLRSSPVSLERALCCVKGTSLQWTLSLFSTSCMHERTTQDKVTDKGWSSFSSCFPLLVSLLSLSLSLSLSLVLVFFFPLLIFLVPSSFSPSFILLDCLSHVLLAQLFQLLSSSFCIPSGLTFDAVSNRIKFLITIVWNISTCWQDWKQDGCPTGTCSI